MWSEKTCQSIIQRNDALVLPPTANVYTITRLFTCKLLSDSPSRLVVKSSREAPVHRAELFHVPRLELQLLQPKRVVCKGFTRSGKRRRRGHLLVVAEMDAWQ
jgi:hypothetical protein